MTPEKAAMIRAGYMAASEPLGKDILDPTLLQEKWLLFMEASTESFILYDSKLNVIEINQATLDLYPAGTRKDDIVGKNLLDILPDLRNRYEIGKYKEIIKTGKPFYAEGDPPPRIFGDKHMNYKAFKVGDGLGMIIRDVTDTKHKEDELKRKTRELEIKTQILEDTNTALKVLLKRREEDKKELEKKVLANIKELIEPYLGKIKGTGLDDRQRTYIELIESNLSDITASFIRKVSDKYIGLSHAEIEIANLIRHGKATKEVADVLCLSPNTIQSYRKNIRKKLGINHKKINFRTYLSSFN
jgi:DNA-binding CsgD family transcriptional regulator